MAGSLSLSLAILAIPATASEQTPRATSVTVAFSVYLAPAKPTTAGSDGDPALSGIPHCDELLTSTAHPDQQTCQRAQTQYRWQEDGKHTLLTIMPI